MINLTYDKTAKSLHWIMAALIFVLLAVGAVMTELPKGDLRADLYDIHKQVGVIVLLLVVPRLAYRFAKGVPALPSTMPPLEQLIAHAGHFALYALMFLVPICGILLSQAGNHPVVLLGFTLPNVIQPDKEWHEFFEDSHGVLAYTTLIIIIGHAGAALRHHLILKDDILKRMLPDWLIKPTTQD